MTETLEDQIERLQMHHLRQAHSSPHEKEAIVLALVFAGMSKDMGLDFTDTPAVEWQSLYNKWAQDVRRKVQ